MVKDETQQSIEKRQIDLFVNLGENGLHEDIAFSFTCLPNIGQIVDSLTPLKEYQINKLSQQKDEDCIYLVNKEWWGFCIL